MQHGSFTAVESAVAARTGSAADNTVPFHDPSAEVTERSMAHAWANVARGRWVYDHTRKAWFRFSGSHWEEDRVRLAFHSMGTLCNKLGKGSKSVDRRGFVAGAEAFAQAIPELAVDHSIFDRDIFLTGTPAGTIDCRTGKLLPADPKQFITKITSVAPEAAEPSLWLRCLNEWTGGDEDTIRFLRQICGYCLTGSTQEHALFNAIGPGKNGKSTFLNTIRRVLGDYACTAPMSTFIASKGDSHPTDQAMLVGARLVTASETEEGRAWAEAKIKNMTGGDPITARFMNKDFFTYQPQFKLIIVGNHLPQLQNVDEATRRRFNIIAFDYVPPQPDPELELKLEAEHGRILNWMIAGCLDWQSNGRLIRPAAVSRATEEYFEAQDLFGQWLAECCETGNGLWELPMPLYQSWCAFTKANGEAPGTAKSFFSDLRKNGFPKAKTSGMRVYRNVALKRGQDA